MSPSGSAVTLAPVLPYPVPLPKRDEPQRNSAPSHIVLTMLFRTCVLTNPSVLQSVIGKKYIFGLETASENPEPLVAIYVIVTSILVSLLKWPCDLDGKRHLSKKPACAAPDSSDSCSCSAFSDFKAVRPPTETPFPVCEAREALRSFAEQR